MVLYNVTISVDEDIEEDWKLWMKNIHIPDVMSTGRFLEFKFLKLLNDSPDVTGVTYAIQYFANSLDDLELYLDNEAMKLQNESQNKYHNKFVAFRTVLEEVS